MATKTATKSAQKVGKPTSIDIGGLAYLIIWLDEVEWQALPGDYDNLRGLSDHVSHTIHMRTFIGRLDGEPAPDSALAVTLLHECLHCVNYVAGIAQWADNMAQLVNGSGDSVDIEEWYTDTVTPTLALFLRSNLGAINWILEAQR